MIKQFRAHPLPDRPTHTRVVLKATFNCSVDSTTLDVGDLSEMEKDVDEQDMDEEDVVDDQGVGGQAVMEDLHLEGPLVISGGDEREGNW